MTLDDAYALIGRLLPHVWRESIFLSPDPQANIAAETVFTAIRELCEPPMSEEDFNTYADNLDHAKDAANIPMGKGKLTITQKEDNITFTFGDGAPLSALWRMVRRPLYLLAATALAVASFLAGQEHAQSSLPACEEDEVLFPVDYTGPGDNVTGDYRCQDGGR